MKPAKTCKAEKNSGIKSQEGQEPRGVMKMTRLLQISVILVIFVKFTVLVEPSSSQAAR